MPLQSKDENKDAYSSEVRCHVFTTFVSHCLASNKRYEHTWKMKDVENAKHYPLTILSLLYLSD